MVRFDIFSITLCARLIEIKGAVMVLKFRGQDILSQNIEGAKHTFMPYFPLFPWIFLIIEGAAAPPLLPP